MLRTRLLTTTSPSTAMCRGTWPCRPFQPSHALEVWMSQHRSRTERRFVMNMISFSPSGFGRRL